MVDEEDFKRISGFWRPRDNQEDARKVERLSEDPGNVEPFVGSSRRAPGSPSAQLLHVLKDYGLNALIPKSTGYNKLDLTFYKLRELEASSHISPWDAEKAASRIGTAMRFQDFVIEHIKNVGPLLSKSRSGRVIDEDAVEKELTRVYSSSALDFLDERGYGIEDVTTWSWIATSDSADQAAMRFSLASQDLANAGKAPFPLFLLFLILGSDDLNARSLKLLIGHVWERCRGKDPQAGKLFVKCDEHPVDASVRSPMVLIVRLIRHARRVLPEALDEIALLMTKLLGADEGENVITHPEQAQKLSHVYNRALTLFAIPASKNPYLSVALHQQAQFRLLRKMVQFRPQLPITREGFRALIKVQVAHKKTESERTWARYKALSWPPWKEHKLGIDFDDNLAGSQSRAREVLLRMNEAGYSHLSWERQAMIYAGWDTDRSPTIQRRKLLGKAPLFRPDDGPDRVFEEDLTQEHEIWAARISSTRTVREAWACFCSFETECGANHMGPWHAMFERLIHVLEEVPEDPVVPGDGKETYPEPTSPHDFLYVPSEPPSVEDLFSRMLDSGVKPAGRLLADLLDHAPTISQGLHYLSHSRFSEVIKDALLRAEKYSSECLQETLSKIPNYTFAAFVRLLTKNHGSAMATDFFEPTSASSLATAPASGARGVRPIRYALRLVEISETRYVPTWTALFSALSQHVKAQRNARLQPYAVYKSWLSLRRLLFSMGNAGIVIEFDIFQTICPVLEQVMLLSHEICGRKWSRFTNGSELQREANLVAKRLFREMVVAPEDVRSSLWLPCESDAALLSIPDPAYLPGLVRVLGVAGDTAGIMSLLRWMSRFAAELGSVSDELTHGARMLRCTLVTMRVFLERSWADHHEPCKVRDSTRSETQSVTDEARSLVELHKSWGGWPSDEEVEDLLKDKMKWAHLNVDLDKARSRAARTSLGEGDHVEREEATSKSSNAECEPHDGG